MASVIELRSNIAAKTKEIAPLARKFLDGELDEGGIETFRKLNGEIERLKVEELDATRGEEERDAAEEMIRLADEYNKPAGSISGQRARQNGRERQESDEQYRSLGDAFANSDVLEEFRGRVGQGRNSQGFRVGSLYHGHEPELSRTEGLAPEMRALITSTTVTDMIQPDRIPGIITPDRAELPVRNLFTNGTTTSNTIEFVREGARTNNAAEVAEATSLTTGQKPESGFLLESDSVMVVTIAHIVYANRNALDDVGQLRMLIDEFLVRGIQERVDRQLLLGNGTSPNMRGLLNTTGIQVADDAYFTANPLPSDANKWDRLRRAMTMVRLTGRGRTSGMVLSPELLEEAAMAKDTSGKYLFPGGGPFGGGFTTLWGVPVTEQEDLDPDQAVVGDFRRGAAVLDRMNAQIFVSDSNRDLFERNIITFLGEARIAFPVYRPGVFVDVDMSIPTTP